MELVTTIYAWKAFLINIIYAKYFNDIHCH
jgi:hypothetical protein